MADLRTDLRTEMADLRTEMPDGHRQMAMWLVGSQAAFLAVVVAMMALLR